MEKLRNIVAELKKKTLLIKKECNLKHQRMCKFRLPINTKHLQISWYDAKSTLPLGILYDKEICYMISLYRWKRRSDLKIAYCPLKKFITSKPQITLKQHLWNIMQGLKWCHQLGRVFSNVSYYFQKIRKHSFNGDDWPLF